MFKKMSKFAFKTTKKLPILFICPSLIIQSAFADALPVNGQVVAGSGTINQTAESMVINQASQNMVVNWDSFNIGQNKTVEFIQPNQNSTALNRVMGNDASVIQGLLKSNGKVFLVNPNGVLFSSSAQVSVGGLVASALQISTEDFMAGRYNFEGTSENAVVNQGSIQAADGGYVAFVAAKITNEGSITANGGDILLGAGSQVTLDLGGPVKLRVEQSAIDALIENGGIIKADGGSIFITAKAAGDLATTVINNTGAIEAKTLATGKKGEIYLLGDMVNDRINVGGRIDASALNGGDGGFVETSASKVVVRDGVQVSTNSANGTSGTWLIDPGNYTIAASGGDISGTTLASNLASGNVVITTTGAGGNVEVNDAVSWSANKLTLTAHNNINVNANLTATGSASLAFIYGQDSANGAGSHYAVNNGAKIIIPNAANFTWKKGTAGATNNLIYNNNLLRFGNGTQAALNQSGTLLQPFYYDDGTSSSRTAGFYKLTYSSYPLDIGIATGGNGANEWNYNGQVLSTGSGYTPLSTSFDISGYQEGIGSIISSVVLAISGSNVQVDNKYTLDANASFIKTDTSIKNIDNSATQTNVRLWVGTRDDYVGQNDSNYKTKGNIATLGSELVPITNQNQRANAVKISESNDGQTGAAVLFYSLSNEADMVTDRCCSFTNVTNKDPRTSQTITPREDGSYALFSRFADLAPGQVDTMTWYYAAAPVTQNAFAAAAPPAPTPAPVVVTPAPVVTVVTPTRGEVAPQVPRVANDRVVNTAVTITPPLASPNLVVEGLEFVSISSPTIPMRASTDGSSGGASFRNIGSNRSPASASTTGDSSSASTVAVESDASVIANVQSANADFTGGLMQVFVYDGGINASPEKN